jgi:ribulose-5-phosphate 4-epimerase/fuculose-1-phosphate aldolase
MNRPDSDLEQLARACRILELEGHGDFTLGHAALRDAEGRGFWMKRNAAGLGEIRGADDFVLVDMEGNKRAGEGGRHSEWPIHSEILRLRPEIQVTFHTHALHACIMSGLDDALVPYTLDADYFIDVPRHNAEVALIKTVEEGDALARAMGTHKALLLANHGPVFCGTSIAEATCVGVFLEHACRAHIVGKSTGSRPLMPTPSIREKRKSQIMTPVHIEQTWAYLNRKLDAALGKAATKDVLYR